MIGSIAVFLLTFSMAALLTLGIVMTLRARLASIFSRKRPDATTTPPAEEGTAAKPQRTAGDAFISGITGFIAQVFFTVVLWSICYKTGLELLAQIKAP